MKKYLILLFSLISVFGYTQTLHPNSGTTALSVNNANTLPTTVSGTNTYTATLPSAGTITDATNFFTDITDRLIYYKFTNAATSAPFTLNLNSEGAKDLKKRDATGSIVDIVATDIAAGQVLPIRYNGTYLVIEGGAGGGSSITTPVSIANGGTNASSQSTNGINYFNGTSITSDATKFFWDGSRLRIQNAGVSATSPQTGTLLHLVSQSNTFNSRLSNDSYVNTQTMGSVFQGRTARGTIASPSASQTDDIIAAWNGVGYKSTGFGTGGNAAMTFNAGSNMTDTNAETYIRFLTTPNASTTLTERFRIGSAGQFGIGGANYGTSGQALISGGSSSAPSWANVTATNVTNTPSGNIAATNVQTAINELDTAVGSTTPIGNVITEAFANITNFTNVGSATFSVVSNALNIAGGSSKTLSNYLRHSAYGNTSCEEWTMTGTVTVGTLSSTSFGVGFGVQGASLAIQGALLLDNTDKGKLAFYFNNGTATELKTNGAIAITAGDNVTLTLTRTRHTFILTATNTTQSNVSITHTLNIENNNNSTYRTPNAGNFAIYALGGTHTLDNFIVNLDAFVSPDILFLGDSFTAGSRSVNYQQRFSNRLQQLINGSVQVNAGGGNLVEDINATEVLRYTPSKIIIFLGTNNKLSAESDASIRTKINTLISSLTGYTLGTNLWICELPPNNTFDATSFNSGLATNYAAGFIGINKMLLASAGTGISATLSPDGTHVNAEGHFLIANAVYNRLKDVLTKNKDIKPYDNPVYKINNKAGFGDQDHTANYAVDIFTNGGTNQFRVGNSLNNDGGYLISNTSTQMMLSGGMYFDGVLKPTSTTASSVNLNTGLITFRTDAGLTAGTTFTPTTRGTFLTNGSFTLGSIQDATFRDTNGGSDLQSPFTVYPPGTTLGSGFASTMGVAGAWSFSEGNGTRQIRRASIGVVGPSDTPGAETGQLTFYTKPAGAAITVAMLIDENQNVGINTAVPTAKLHLPAGTATANTAPLKLTSGTNLTTPEAGAVEFDGTSLYFSPSTVRRTVMTALVGSATLDFGGTPIAAGGNESLTITVTGAADGDEVILGVPNASFNAGVIYTARVSASNTVSVQAVNSTASPVDPGSGTFKVSVIKR